MAKYKHLTINERHDIEQCLNKQHSFKEIGKVLNRDPTTISKEVVGHIKVRCGECNSTCSSYEEERCPELGLPPYVCNGCKRITRCQLQKQYYYGDFAQQEYEAVRSESRQGIATAPEELQQIDAVISPLVK